MRRFFSIFKRFKGQKKSMELSVKKAEASDVGIMFSIRIIAFEPLLKIYEDYETNPANESISSFVSKFNDKTRDFYLICEGDKEIGCVCVKHLTDALELSSLCLLPKYQNRGAASKTVGELEALYGENKIWKLSCPADLEKNVHFYKKLGYAETGEIKKVNEKLTLAFFEKHIGNKTLP